MKNNPCFRHNDPVDRLHPANARISIMHFFAFAPRTDEERDSLFDLLERQRDIWLKEGLSAYGAVGTMPPPIGRIHFFEVQTPRRDLAMLFKLRFEGSQ